MNGMPLVCVADRQVSYSHRQTNYPFVDQNLQPSVWHGETLSPQFNVYPTGVFSQNHQNMMTSLLENISKLSEITYKKKSRKKSYRE